MLSFFDVANGPSESAESALLMNVYRGLAILVSSGILVPLINLLLKARFFGLLQGRELLLGVLCMVLRSLDLVRFEYY